MQTHVGLEARIDGPGEREKLALLDGAPIRYREWPKWPRADATTQRNLLDVLHSAKWTISGQSDRIASYEQRFAQAFAEYCGRQFCVPCGNGTAALTIGLQSLGIGPGDEVIVPGLTWVACASAVCHVGAIPILADIDPSTLCISTASVQALISRRTAAIMMVHLYSALAPIAEILDLAGRAGIAVIEDASQAHGAKIGGRRTGSFGNVSAFSMQQSKMLTSGEGGACLTDNADAHRRMQQFRADGRGLAGADGYDPYREIVPYGEVLGRNLCLSEFHAAILLDALNRLDIENSHRRRNFAQLTLLLTDVPGVSVVTDERVEEPTHYKVCLRFEAELLDGLEIGLVARALAEELSLPVEPIDAPLNANTLYQPLQSPQISRMADAAETYDPRRFSLPNATAAARCCLTLPHWCLLGDRSDLDDIVSAILKVLQFRNELSQLKLGDIRRYPFRTRQRERYQAP
jgi:dTDP-4-amino-4,6-dideoxygalactose transaminase